MKKKSLMGTNFWVVFCPKCEKYKQTDVFGFRPIIRWRGIRQKYDQQSGKDVLEVQGNCTNCSCEYRLLVPSRDYDIPVLLEPKKGSKKGRLGKVTDFIRRFGLK